MSIKDRISGRQMKDKVEEEDWQGTTIHSYDSIPGPPRSKSSKFSKDFRTGLGFLFIIGFIIIAITVILFILKVGVVLIIPFVILGAFIFLIALLGRVINLIRKKA